jgi:hypothetical protein
MSNELEGINQEFVDVNRDAERAKLSMSGHRIDKILDRMSSLRRELKSYLKEGQKGYTTAEKIKSLFRRVENLLNRMDDYDFSDREKNEILDILGEMEQIKRAFIEVSVSGEDANSLAETYDPKFNYLQQLLDELSKNRVSKLKFEGGYAQRLAGALNEGGVDEAERIVLEIDRLLMDDYAEFRQVLAGDTALKFRLGRLSNPKECSRATIELTPTNVRGAKLVFDRSKTNEGARTYEFKISIQGLDADQDKVWRLIQ